MAGSGRVKCMSSGTTRLGCGVLGPFQGLKAGGVTLIIFVEKGHDRTRIEQSKLAAI